MKKIIFVILLICSQGFAQITPNRFLTNDVGSVKKSFIQVNERSSVNLFVTFEEGGLAKDITGANTVLFIYGPPNGAVSATITGSVVNASSGEILIPFTPANTATNTRNTAAFEFNIVVSQGAAPVLLSVWGNYDVIRRAGGSGTISFTTNINWANFEYLNTATDGPYRAGTNITFSINVDGSVDINGAAGTDTTFTNFWDYTGIGTFTGLPRSGSNTLTITASDIQAAITNATFTNSIAVSGGLLTLLGTTNSGNNTIGLTANAVNSALTSSGVTAVANGVYLRLSGVDTMTGPLKMGEEEIEDVTVVHAAVGDDLVLNANEGVNRVMIIGDLNLGGSNVIDVGTLSGGVLGLKIESITDMIFTANGDEFQFTDATSLQLAAGVEFEMAGHQSMTGIVSDITTSNGNSFADTKFIHDVATFIAKALTLNILPGANVTVVTNGLDRTISSSGGGGGASSFLDLTDSPASYVGQAGKVVTVNSGTTGVEFVELETNTVSVLNGLFLPPLSLFVTNVGGIVYAEIEAIGGGDIAYYFSNVLHNLNCTSSSGTAGRARAVLVSATNDAVPVQNLVYVTDDNAIASVVSTITIPTNVYGAIGGITLRTPARTLSDGFPLTSRIWNDSINDKGRGIIARITEAMRVLDATLRVGGEPAGSIGLGDTVKFSTLSGIAYSGDRQAFAVFPTNSPIVVVNHPDAPYTVITNLSEITQDASTNTIANNERIGITMGILIGSGDDSIDALVAFLPSDVYPNGGSGETDALTDADSFDRSGIPQIFLSKIVPLCRVVMQKSATGYGSIVVQDKRFKTLLERGGGSGSTAGHEPVTISGENYASLVAQQIIFSAIDLANNVTGVLPDANVAGDLLLEGASTTGSFTFATGTVVEVQLNSAWIFNNNPVCNAFPWGDIEVVDSLTISGAGSVDDGALSATVANLNVVETITANWVNTANPWANNEVADNLTLTGANLGGDLDAGHNSISNLVHNIIDLTGSSNDLIMAQSGMRFRCLNSMTVVLPAISVADIGVELTVKARGTNHIVVIADTGDTIDHIFGSVSNRTTNVYSMVTLVLWSSTNWLIEKGRAQWPGQ